MRLKKENTSLRGVSCSISKRLTLLLGPDPSPSSQGLPTEIKSFSLHHGDLGVSLSVKQKEPAKTMQHGSHQHRHCMHTRGWWVHTGPCVSGSTQLKGSSPNGLPV